MENGSFDHPRGRLLTKDDIDHIDGTLLLPATRRCQKGVFDGGVYVIRKAPGTPSLINGSMRYYPRFRSEFNRETGLHKYTVAMGALEDATFDQLSMEERDQLRMQFRAQYMDEGGELSDLNDDDEWQSLITSDQYDDVHVSMLSMQEYAFTDAEAIRSYTIERRLTVSENTYPRSLGRFSLDASVGRQASRRTADSEADGLFDAPTNGYSRVSSGELGDIVTALKMLELITLSDQAAFERGVSR
jgi:hypothetical protein